MELGRTENSKIIFIHTDDLKVTIKCGASVDSLPFVAPDQLESSVVFECKSILEPSVSCDPMFFEQKSYTLIAESREGHTLEFNHENVYLRKNIACFGRKNHVLSGTLIFKLDGQKFLRIMIEVYPYKVNYKKDYQEILEDVSVGMCNLPFDAFRSTYDSYSLSEKNGNSPIVFFTIIREIYKDFKIAADMIVIRPHHVLQSDPVVLSQHNKVRRTDTTTFRRIEKHQKHVT